MIILVKHVWKNIFKFISSYRQPPIPARWLSDARESDQSSSSIDSISISCFLLAISLY